jgi:hypothetical protein
MYYWYDEGFWYGSDGEGPTICFGKYPPKNVGNE